MPAGDRIAERLPALYRPDPSIHGDSLFGRHVDAVGGHLDELSEAASAVLQSHWFRYSDSALFSEFVRLSREQDGTAPIGPSATEDIAAHPWLFSLPRIAGLLDLKPWREPLATPETVEQFRRRMRRTVAMYRQGLGTLGALRLATATALPVLDDGNERPFTVEEFVSDRHQSAHPAVKPNDDGLLGALASFNLRNRSRSAALPQLMIDGLAPDANVIQATVNPMVELRLSQRQRVGVAWEGSIEPGRTLGILPSYHLWSASASGIDRADSIPEGASSADPTAIRSAFVHDDNGPGGNVVALLQTADKFLWALTNDSGVSELWRSNGSDWALLAGGLPGAHCLLEHGAHVLVGFDNGICRLEQHVPAATLQPDPATLTGFAVRDLKRFADGNVWAATANGLAQVDLANGDQLLMSALGATPLAQTALNVVYEDDDGAIFAGGERGLFLWRPLNDHWYFYSGLAADDQVPDWRPFVPGEDDLPADNEVFLPSVNDIRRGRDTSLWLATDRGIARYLGLRSDGTSTALLEALPILVDAPVRAIKRDERQRLWFCTDNGVLVHDEVDWRQRVADRITLLTRPALVDGLRFWRFDRTTDQWQQLSPPSSDFVPFVEPPLAQPEASCNTVLWTDGATPRWVTRDGDGITATGEPDPVGRLRVRFKPDAITIIDGGIPALPRLPPSGVSHWRYLTLEPSPVPTPSATPAWTSEGRLIPPPEKYRDPQSGYYPSRLGFEDAEPQPNQVFAFCYSARLYLKWPRHERLTVTVRLSQLSPGEVIDPVVIDRVWANINKVKPAGVQLALAVGETFVRGVET